MNNQELYEALELPAEVVSELNEYEKTRTMQIGGILKDNMYCREKWDGAVKEIQELLGEDTTI